MGDRRTSARNLTSVNAGLYTRRTRPGTAIGKSLGRRLEGEGIGGPQIELRPRGMRLPILGSLIGLTGLVGLLHLRSRNKRHRPTGAELMRMSDGDFAEFIRSSGLKTITTAGLAAPGGHAD